MNRIIYLISKHIDIFELFTEVYIFGSVVKNNKFPNDIDLLLVYRIYSEEIEGKKNMIEQFLKNLFELEIDITILSEKELEQTKFLEKLDSVYERIK
ncbi:nucleotidyltransferase domain-containing protein [Sulfurospirillum halorespirans]|uniref:Putative nucleotidyltransferase n=1 Tax=Sulfurospirillum halorespirans DSM 13726 TaxID=1193502 RepID=A0A1D7TGV3_9BACT|nr:nucleotidyltransferase domain-containing protein [Sulfurospirillum halorespirans]AOO64227.1 putative nucleotidyltransferase [Sulfurospirillum halorespirans DSM 13726]